MHLAQGSLDRAEKEIDLITYAVIHNKILKQKYCKPIKIFFLINGLEK